MASPSTGSQLRFQRDIEAAFAATLIDRDILEELAQHAESAYEAMRADGMSAEQASARITAMIAGWRSDPAALQRVVRRPAPVTPPPASQAMFAGALADVTYGVRVLRAQRGAAALTILTIALGVGAVTTLFSVANSVLLRPLSWATGDGLVRVIESRGGRQGRVPGTMMNGPFLAWADAPQTIEGIGSWTTGAVTLTGAGDATRVTVANVSPSLLALLGAQPLRGRVFAADEGRNQQWRIAILSQGLWEQRFGARDDIVGGTIMLEGAPATVIGIMPRSFRFPTGDIQLWLPMSVATVDGPNGVKRGQIFSALARLKPGVSLEQAAAEATARAVAAPDAGLTAMSLFGAKEPVQIALVDANEAATAEVRPAIVILLIAAALLFVTAIANVANMQLARAAARHRELTIRAALGAATARLSRQLLIENAVVAVAGALLGVALSAALHRALPALLPPGFPRADEIAIDGRVLIFAAVIAVVASLAAGVLPVLQARRLDLARALSDGTLASAGSGRGRLAMARLGIVASQVAVTSVLVIGAVLLTRSFMARMAADRGYDPANVLTASVPFPTSYSFEQRQQARGRILERLRERPGITHAAFSSGVPLISSGGFASFDFVTPLKKTPIQAETMRRLVTPDYFGALGMRLRAGRALSDADALGAPTAVVVNRSFVRKYLDDMPIEQAVGQSLGAAAVRGTQPDGPATIVGVEFNRDHSHRRCSGGLCRNAALGGAGDRTRDCARWRDDARRAGGAEPVAAARLCGAAGRLRGVRAADCRRRVVRRAVVQRHAALARARRARGAGREPRRRDRGCRQAGRRRDRRGFGHRPRDGGGVVEQPGAIPVRGAGDRLDEFRHRADRAGDGGHSSVRDARAPRRAHRPGAGAARNLSAGSEDPAYLPSTDRRHVSTSARSGPPSFWCRST
jgi:predicted permease